MTTLESALQQARQIAYGKWMVFKQEFERQHPMHIGNACQHRFVQDTDSHGYAWKQGEQWKASARNPGFSVGEFYVVDFDGRMCSVSHEPVEGML